MKLTFLSNKLLHAMEILFPATVPINHLVLLLIAAIGVAFAFTR
jgi:hypothetical protein